MSKRDVTSTELLSFYGISNIFHYITLVLLKHLFFLINRVSITNGEKQTPLLVAPVTEFSPLITLINRLPSL